MAELKDPAIKLFGKTIQLPETPAVAAECDGGVSVDVDRRSSSDSLPAESNEDGVGTGEQGADKLSSGGRTHDSRVEDGAEDGSQSMMSENQLDSHLSALPKESGCVDSEADLAKDSKVEGDQEEKSNPQDKTLKKPDKILPCPRCNSLDTKFCYFNNYNVNQPRHFCKSCQRYWTAGGSMRNVAIGAGRRKNKNSASQCRNPDVAYHSQVDIPNGIFHPAQKSNGAVLTFGSDSPLCESMASVLNIADRKMHAGFQGTVDVKVALPYGTAGNGNDDIGRSLPTLSSTPKEEVGRDVLAEKLVPNCQSFPLQIPPQMPYFPGAPWPYPWVPVQWNPQTVPTAFCPPGFPMGFYPAVPYWGCPVPGGMPGGWSLPWINPPYTSLPTQTSGPNSPTLGKHSRDNSMPSPVNEEEPWKERVIESDPEKCLWVPKTLRIGDPKDAAKISIWATLGIRDDTGDSPGASLFKTAFPSRGDEKTHITEASSVLQANPAALSRSMTFHERS